MGAESKVVFMPPVPPEIPHLSEYIKVYGETEGPALYKKVMRQYRTAQDRYDKSTELFPQLHLEWKEILLKGVDGGKEEPKKSHRISLVINTLYIQWCLWVLVVCIRGTSLAGWIKQDPLYYVGFVATIFIVLGFILDLSWKIKPYKWMPRIERFGWILWMIFGILTLAGATFFHWWIGGLTDPAPMGKMSFIPFAFPVVCAPFYFISVALTMYWERKQKRTKDITPTENAPLLDH